ncbi:MAG: hypothetical protein ABIW16_05620 [Sphingomicrobium sp.]
MARGDAAPSGVYAEVVAANADYAAQFGGRGDLALPPARGFAISTCMDARLDSAKYADSPRATRTSSVTPAGGRATTRSARW